MNFRKPQIQLVIADDHPSFREGLRRLLEAEPDHKVIGEASDGAEAVKLTRQLKPDILLLDLRMREHSDGLEALRELSTPASATLVRVILLAAEIEKSQIVEALQLGAKGVVLQDSAVQVLSKAIQTVMAREYWVLREPVSNLEQCLRTLMQSIHEEVWQKTFGPTPRDLETVSKQWQCGRGTSKSPNISCSLGVVPWACVLGTRARMIEARSRTEAATT